MRVRLHRRSPARQFGVGDYGLAPASTCAISSGCAFSNALIAALISSGVRCGSGSIATATFALPSIRSRTSRAAITSPALAFSTSARTICTRSSSLTADMSTDRIAATCRTYGLPGPPGLPLVNRPPAPRPFPPFGDGSVLIVYGDSITAVTIATTPARIALGSVGQASTTTVNSGESSDTAEIDPCSYSASLVQTGVQTGELGFAGSVTAVFGIDDHLLRDEEVAGSNPVTPMNNPVHQGRVVHWGETDALASGSVRRSVALTVFPNGAAGSVQAIQSPR